MKRLALALLVPALACSGPGARQGAAPSPAPSATSAAGAGLYLGEAATAQGLLEPVRVDRAAGGSCIELRLAGRAVGEDCESESAFVQAVHPAEGPARLVLVGLGPGGNTCPEFYRVVEVPPGGPARVSERFGNCSELTSATWTGEGWRIEVPAYGGDSFLHPRGPAQAWLYRDGRVAPTPGKAP